MKELNISTKLVQTRLTNEGSKHKHKTSTKLVQN